MSFTSSRWCSSAVELNFVTALLRLTGLHAKAKDAFTVQGASEKRREHARNGCGPVGVKKKYADSFDASMTRKAIRF